MLGQMGLNQASIVMVLALVLSLSSFYVAQPVWAKDAQKDYDDGLPTRRVGGGSRGCPLLTPTEQAAPETLDHECAPVIALIPERLVVTAEAAPTLFFYIPQIKQPQAVEVEFVLRDEKDDLIYQTTFKTTGKAGLVSLKIPASDTIEGLTLHQNYHWYLSVIYDPSDRAHDDVVEGWIRRESLDPTLARQIAQAAPLEQIELYRKADLWQESLSTLLELKRSRPNDPQVSQLWRQLLESVNLGDIAQKSL